MTSLLIARRDLNATLHGLTGYAIIAAILFIDGILFNAYAMGQGARYSHQVLEQFFYFSSGTTMIASVLITMRSVAEERQTRTMLLLDSAPVLERQIIIGKFLAAMAVVTILTLLTVYMPLLIFVNGKVSLGHIAVGYVGLLALGACTTALGVFSSSLFHSQMAAAIFSAVLVVSLLICWLLAGLTDPPFSEILAYMALFDKHFLPFHEGRLPTQSLFYYASVTGVALLAATRNLERRRWL